MRVCLYANENAGDGVSLEHIAALVRRFGHTITKVIHHSAELPRTLDAVDCVAAVGGDGTIARVARVLAGGPIPLAVLPAGTANNIATSLEIDGTLETLIARWNDQRVVTIDVGVVREGANDSHFLEAVGTGLITSGIRRGRDAVSKDDESDAGRRLARARQIFLDAVYELRPRHQSLTIDGTEINGDYLLIEVLNIRSIGPGICLSKEASAADGLLTVVVALESDRQRLAEHLRANLTGSDCDIRLESWRATRVELRDSGELHVDDEVREAKDDVLVTIKPASLHVLA
jgi:diacylglycerol kinase family enzyme